MKYYKISNIIFLIILLIEVTGSIILKDIRVPHLVVLDDTHQDNGDSNEGDDLDHYDDGNVDAGDPITSSSNSNEKNIQLECLYELKADPSYLVVKWFMNDNLIYQWIRGQMPSVFPHLKEHVGRIKAVSTELNHEYSGVNLVKPSTELSGVYKCVVQTENDSKFKEKTMHIVDIRNYTFVFDYARDDNGTLLECAVSNIYPKPILHIEVDDIDDDDDNDNNVNDSNDDDDDDDNDDDDDDGDSILLVTKKTFVNVLDNGYYDATLVAIQTDDGNDKDVNHFKCVLTFDGLHFNLTARHSSSSASSSIISSTHLLSNLHSTVTTVVWLLLSSFTY